MKVCPNCRTKNEDRAEECSNCGANLIRIKGDGKSINSPLPPPIPHIPHAKTRVETVRDTVGTPSVTDVWHATYGSGVYSAAKSKLSKKDGMIHVVLVTSFSRIADETFAVDPKFTVELDTFLMEMQKDGYEILDVKMNTIPDQGLTGTRMKIHTLVTYR